MINRFLWEEILKEAERRGIPQTKKRAILREFLQVKFLTSFYHLPDCYNFSFIGGTSLRLLRGLDRFSEDLDFDIFDAETKGTNQLFKKATADFQRENYELEFDSKKTKLGGSARMRFSNLLYELKISQNPKEKLMIKIDFTYQKRIETEVVLLAEFGMSERIVTNTLPVLLSQKFKALISRKQTRGRDFYDVYWLLSYGIKPNEPDFFLKLGEMYQKEKTKIPFYKRQIRPFLLHEENQRYLDLLGDLINKGS